MKAITPAYIHQAVGGEAFLTHEEPVREVVIDSRKVAQGSLFFAVRGAKNDGHDFIPAAYESGCRAVVIDEEAWVQRCRAMDGMNVFFVPNVTNALMALAKQYLADWEDLKRVAVTGSVGKTSTKEFLAAVLGSRYRVGKTPGNLNSEYGLPLTIFGFDEDIEVAVLEMGAGSTTHLRDLADIAKPDVAVLTNVGSAHLEVFHTREKLAEEKLAVASGLGPGGLLVLNADSDYPKEEQVKELLPAGAEVVHVGTSEASPHAEYRLREICDKGVDGVQSILDICIDPQESVKLELPTIGAHNLLNAALAVAAGAAFGISAEEATAALKNMKPVGKRLEVLEIGDITVINDAYNASPESMKAAIRVLRASEAKRRVAFLGDMYELGEDSNELHASVGKAARDAGIDLLITAGENALSIALGATGGETEVHAFLTREEAFDALPSLMKPGDLLLLKASRAMALEEAVQVLERNL